MRPGTMEVLKGERVAENALDDDLEKNPGCLCTGSIKRLATRPGTCLKQPGRSRRQVIVGDVKHPGVALNTSPLCNHEILPAGHRSYQWQRLD
jgi:hypothetical protein